MRNSFGDGGVFGVFCCFFLLLIFLFICFKCALYWKIDGVKRPLSCIFKRMSCYAAVWCWVPCKE